MDLVALIRIADSDDPNQEKLLTAIDFAESLANLPDE